MNNKMNLKLLKEWGTAVAIAYGVYSGISLIFNLLFEGAFNLSAILPGTGTQGLIFAIFTIIMYSSFQRLFNQFGKSRDTAFLSTLLVLIELALISSLLAVFKPVDFSRLDFIISEQSFFKMVLYRYMISVYSSVMNIALLLLFVSFLSIFKSGKIKLVVAIGVIIGVMRILISRVLYYTRYDIPESYYKIAAFFGFSNMEINYSRFALTTVLCIAIPAVIISFFLTKAYKLNVKK